MNVTKFIKLFKPGYNETADIEILNQNSDKIDAQFEEQSKTLAGKEPIITKKSGFNLDKTDLTENDSNKIFTALGALNLKNWLVTNYTSLMNHIKEALDTKIETLKASLTSLINTKLNHGGYSGTGQDLKNLADSKVSKAGDTMSGELTVEKSHHPAFWVNNTTPDNIDKSQGFFELVDNGDIHIGVRNKNIAGQGQKLLIWESDKEGVIYHSGNKPIVRDLEYLGFLDGNTTTFDNLRDKTGYYEVSGVPNTVFNPIQGVYMFGQLHVTYAYYSILQTYYSHANGWILTRMWWNDAWTPWRKVYTSIQVPRAGAYLLGNNVKDFTFNFVDYDYFIIGSCWNGALATQPTGNCIYTDVAVGEMGSGGLDSGARFTGFNWRAFGNPEGLTRRFSNFQGTSSVTGAVVWGVKLS